MGIGETKLTSKNVPYLFGLFCCVVFVGFFGWFWSFEAKKCIYFYFFLKKLKSKLNCSQELDCASSGPVYKCNPVYISSHNTSV